MFRWAAKLVALGGRLKPVAFMAQPTRITLKIADGPAVERNRETAGRFAKGWGGGEIPRHGFNLSPAPQPPPTRGGGVIEANILQGICET